MTSQPPLPHGAAGHGPAACRVSIVVKALNEEAKIEACLRSCLAAAAEVPGHCEVVLADARSTDRTVDIAAKLPVRVVQLQHLADRGCGSGVQLGYQHSVGEVVFFVDGDMVVQPGFLPAALAELQADARLGGVAGLLVDVAVRNAFDAHRVDHGVSAQARAERWLNGGGVYRRSAIEAAGGYAADRNLKGWEEAELGMRVRASGYALRRIAVPAVQHDGHALGTAQVLRSLWRSGRAFASGVLLRQALGRPWWPDAVRLLAHPLATLAWWATGLLAAAVALGWGRLLPVALWAAAGLVALAALAQRKRSLARAAMSLGLWHFWAAGLVRGLLLPRHPPREPIASQELHAPGAPG